MTKQTCRTCRFGVPNGDKFMTWGRCHRYPSDKLVEKGDHWCGEWVDKDQRLPTWQSRPVSFVGVADKVVNP